MKKQHNKILQPRVKYLKHFVEYKMIDIYFLRFQVVLLSRDKNDCVSSTVMHFCYTMEFKARKNSRMVMGVWRWNERGREIAKLRDERPRQPKLKYI